MGMTEQEKREKVIKGLEVILEETADMFYRSSIQDTLALLKAQEPREPHYTRLEYMINGIPVVVQHPECHKCIENGLMLWDAEIARGVKFCKRCGQAVKWE